MANLTLKTVFSAIDKMSGPMKTITSKMEKFNTIAGKVSRMGAAFAKGVAVVGAASVAAGAAVFKATEAFAERGDDIVRNAGILGLTAEGYQELSYAAMKADVETESFASASKKLNANLGALKSKQGSLYTALSKTNPALALQLRDVKNTDEAFQLVSEAIAEETDVQKRAALAVAAFGKTGQELIPMMDGLAAARKEARDSGSIILDKDISAASQLDDSLKRIKAVGLGALNSTLGSIADKITPIIDRITAWVSANRELIATKIEETISKVGDIIGFLASPGVISGLAALAIGIKAIGVASMVLGAGNPMILAVGAVAGLITLIVANWSKITEFFDKLGGGEGTTYAAEVAADPWAQRNAADGMQSKTGKSNTLDPWAQRNAAMSTPIGPASSYSETKSTLQVDFSGMPAGAAMKQTGKAPGITVNLGNTMVPMRRQGN